MKKRVLLPATLERMLDRFRTIDERERIKPMNVKIHRTRALLLVFAAAVVATVLSTLIETNPAWTAVSRTFEPAQGSPITVGSAPTTVTNADFNNDGKMDLAAQNSGSGTVSVLLGNGDGTFQAKQDFLTGSNPTSVIGKDLNDDGKMDLAVSNSSSNTVSVLLGNGDGTFQAKQDFPTGFDPTSVISADFNGDRYADLAVANLTDSSVSVLLGQDANGDGKADGTFQPKTNYPVFSKTCNDFICAINTGGPNQVITADFNGDNRADLATANVGGCDLVFPCGPGGVSVLLGNGSGGFQNASLATGGTPITSIDANAAGDIMATKYNDNIVSVLRSNGNGTFFTGPQLLAGTNPSAVTSVDLDGDARADLAVSNFGSDNVSVLFNNGSGSFGAAQNFPAGDGPAFVIGARLNADTFPDLAVANQNSANQNLGNVSVLLNTAPPPETTITSGPPNPDKGTSATFEFTSSEPDSTFQCALDDPTAYSPCTSPATVPGQGSLADGPHTFYVKATGGASNRTDPTPAMYPWTVDATSPDTTILSGPSGYVKSTSASFTFSSSEEGSTFRCSLGSAPFTACASPMSYQGLAQGSHGFRVRAIDEAGNADTTPASRTWFVDTLVPGGTISINGGNASTSSRSVTLKLSASDPSPASGVASMRFRNGGTTTWSAWSTYSTSKPWTLSAGAGTKTVYVQYRDRARNVSASASDTIRFNP